MVSRSAPPRSTVQGQVRARRRVLEALVDEVDVVGGRGKAAAAADREEEEEHRGGEMSGGAGRDDDHCESLPYSS